MKKNKNLYYWLGGLAVVIVLAAVVVFSQGEQFQGRLALKQPVSSTTTTKVRLPDSRLVTCTDFVYSPWGPCVDGTQSRKVMSSSPRGCAGGTPVLTQKCTSAVEPAPTPSEPPTPSVPEPTIPVAPANFSGSLQVDTAGGGLSGVVVAGEEPTLLTMKVATSEAVTVKGFTVQVNEPSSASRINLFDNANNKLGDCVPLPNGLCQITNANIIVNPNSSTFVYVKPSLNTVNPPLVSPDSGQTIKAKFVSLDKVLTSTNSEVQNIMTVTQADMYGREFVIRASKPVITSVQFPPSDLSLPQPGLWKILNLKIDAKGEDDVIFSHAYGNTIKIMISGKISGNQVSGDKCQLTDGMVIYHYTDDSLKSHLSTGIPYSFDFSLNDLVIPSGTSKNLYIECDTTGATAVNDKISATLSKSPMTVQWGDGQIDNIVTDGALLEHMPVSGQIFVNF